jgi:anti-sigma-K factor RskA
VSPPPPEAVWAAIAGRLTANDDMAAPDKIVARWRAFAIASSSLAAALALFLLFQSPPPRETSPAEPLLVASLQSDSTASAATISLDASAQHLLVTPVSLPKGQRVPELWIIPEDGKARSLGVIDAAAPSRVSVRPEKRAYLHSGASFAITLEPPGGSPTGVATGPIVASGKILGV